MSSAPMLSVPDVESEEPAEIRAIWGTTVNLAEVMKLIHDFFLRFKIKYRVAYDREHGLHFRVLATPEEGEIVLYEV